MPHTLSLSNLSKIKKVFSLTHIQNAETKPNAKIKTKSAYLFIFMGLLGLTSVLLNSCGVQKPPNNTNDICAIFKEYPKWYWEAQSSYHQWGVPTPVSMAIIREESYFVSNAQPPRTKLLGVIPWTRPTSAYGFSQATDGTWADYQQATKNRQADRDEFGDAVDFVGWYGNMAHQKIGISKSNAYDLYLAYHEGIGGYEEKSFRKKPWLMDKARKVQNLAIRYQRQLKYCRSDIPRASAWNLWLM